MVREWQVRWWRGGGKHGLLEVCLIRDQQRGTHARFDFTYFLCIDP